ncbi:hypothetical protein [Halosquirtibacter xylanolyticus]
MKGKEEYVSAGVLELTKSVHPDILLNEVVNDDIEIAAGWNCYI